MSPHIPIEAAARVRKFLEERARMRSIDQEEIHALNIGHPDREALLLREDLWALVRLVESE